MRDESTERGGGPSSRKYAPGGAHPDGIEDGPDSPAGARPPNVLSARCPSRRTLEVIADKWTVLVIAAITRGHTRNGALLREVGGVSQKVLTSVLRRLEQHGLVDRTVVARRPLHVEYALTDVGASLVPIVHQLGRWAEEHLDVAEPG